MGIFGLGCRVDAGESDQEAAYKQKLDNAESQFFICR